MTFLEQIFSSLEQSGDAVVLQEVRDDRPFPARPGSCSLRCTWRALICDGCD